MGQIKNNKMTNIAISTTTLNVNINGLIIPAEKQRWSD